MSPVEVVHVSPRMLTVAEIAQLPAEGLHDEMVLACREMGTLEGRAGALAVIIGTLARRMKDNPESWQSLGCVGFDEYKERFILPHFKRSRAAIGNYLAIAERWGHRQLEECSEVGVNKMYEIQRYASGPTAEELFEYAKSHTQSELREELERRGIATKGTTTGASKLIQGSVDAIEDISRFLKTHNVEEMALALAEENNGVNGHHVTISGTERQCAALNEALQGEENPVVAILHALRVPAESWL